jgi:hypothetical protein
MRGYVFPNYASSAYGSSSPMSRPSAIFVAPGYYSDGTNWALVGDSTATTGYNNGEIIEVGTCETGYFYYYNTYDMYCNLIETGNVCQLDSMPPDIWYNDIYAGVSYQLFNTAPYTSSPNLIFPGFFFNSYRCDHGNGGGFE